ncbi:MAG: histidine kinase [Cyclobacterium sp.]|uniref:sensor histidine kinase n=1 Tax=unclassified Cyclobacterium TaxID=2615055 RepID=UPI0013D82A8A|nr:histidine kinase [Cyclobacterium sp. SYSU L10401]
MRSPKTFFQKYQTAIIHVLAWSIFFLLPVIFQQGYQDDRSRSVHSGEFLSLNTLTSVFWVLLFYLNTLILIPKLLYHKKFLWYFLIHLCFFLLVIYFHRLLFGLLLPDLSFVFYRSAFYNGFPFIFVVLAAIAFRAVSDKIKSDSMANERLKENLKTELAFLRSQISPHFILNILNNMVALARMKSEALEPSLMKLSSLMRYMLFETDEEKVPLKTELEYLQSYMDLQQQRIGSRLKLVADLQATEDWHSLEPMLLIPFVENALKHGTGMIPDPAIYISLKTKDSQLHFSVKNKYSNQEETRDPISGIDLANVSRRLELLYGSNHSLSIEKTDGWFTVNLQLTFKP